MSAASGGKRRRTTSVGAGRSTRPSTGRHCWHSLPTDSNNFRRAELACKFCPLVPGHPSIKSPFSQLIFNSRPAPRLTQAPCRPSPHPPASAAWRWPVSGGSGLAGAPAAQPAAQASPTTSTDPKSRRLCLLQAPRPSAPWRVRPERSVAPACRSARFRCPAMHRHRVCRRAGSLLAAIDAPPPLPHALPLLQSAPWCAARSSRTSPPRPQQLQCPCQPCWPHTLPLHW